MKDLVQHHSRSLLSGRHFQSIYDSQHKISQYTGPLLILHGRSDKTIPIAQGASLAAAATSASIVHFVTTDGSHKSPQNESYNLRLAEFLKSTCSRASHDP